MNCGDMEENPGELDQCYSNNNFVTTAVLGVKNYVLLELGCVNLIELLLLFWSRNQLWNCTHFRHPTDEQLRN